jgi:ferredoxin--NADP+ reductase/benzoate/toluate 1,2-dioxygenase reductase subunit
MDSQDSFRYQVLKIAQAGEGNVLIRTERKAMQFTPGQYLCAGIPGQIDLREYTIYSGNSDDYLEILVRIVPTGLVSCQLAQIQAGDWLHMEGPFGHFGQNLGPGPYLALATGTGISPFHSFYRSSPNIDLTVAYGTRTTHQAVPNLQHNHNRLVHCVSREPGGDYHGRVTTWLQTQDIQKYSDFLLCGNCDMIYDAFGLLQELGVGHDQIHTEVYF